MLVVHVSSALAVEVHEVYILVLVLKYAGVFFGHGWVFTLDVAGPQVPDDVMIFIRQFAYLQGLLTLGDLQKNFRVHRAIVFQLHAEKNPLLQVDIVLDVFPDLLQNSPELVLPLPLYQTPEEVARSCLRVVVEELPGLSFTKSQTKVLISDEFISDKLLHNSETILLPVRWVIDVGDDRPELVQCFDLGD